MCACVYKLFQTPNWSSRVCLKKDLFQNTPQAGKSSTVKTAWIYVQLVFTSLISLWGLHLRKWQCRQDLESWACSQFNIPQIYHCISSLSRGTQSDLHLCHSVQSGYKKALGLVTVERTLSRIPLLKFFFLLRLLSPGEEKKPGEHQ